MKENRDKHIEEHLSKLIEKIDSPEREQEILEFYKRVSCFNNYSFHNIWFLRGQARERGMNISYIASFKELKELGAKIKKGSRSLKVFAPKQNFKIKRDDKGQPLKNKKGKYIYELDEHSKKIPTAMGYIQVPVFDVSQTDAQEKNLLPTLNYRNEGNTLSQEMLSSIIKKVEKTYDVKIELKDLQNISLGGYYIKPDKSITINNGNQRSNNTIAGTLFHELRHHILHNKEDYEAIHLNRGEKEGERESVSYILTQHLGIEQKSHLYLKSWERNEKNMRSRLTRIVNASKDIMKNIDFEKIIKEELEREKITSYYLDEEIKSTTPSYQPSQSIQKSPMLEPSFYG